MENQKVRAISFGKLQKIIAVSWDHESLLPFLVCWADLDILCISGRSPTASNFIYLSIYLSILFYVYAQEIHPSGRCKC